MTEFSNLSYFGFLALVLITLLAFLGYMISVFRASGKWRWISLILLGWLTLTGILAQTGFFDSWDTVPPRVMMLLGIPTIFLLVFIFHKNLSKPFIVGPTGFPIYIQGFRVVVEIFLWRLYIERVLPIQMTIEGLNFDMLIGISVPIIALLMVSNVPYYKTILKIWNIIGILALTNIVIIAIMSTPTFFRVFMEGPANTILAHIPFVWLPAFLVPLAYLMHIISLKQLISNAK